MPVGVAVDVTAAPEMAVAVGVAVGGNEVGVAVGGAVVAVGGTPVAVGVGVAVAPGSRTRSRVLTQGASWPSVLAALAQSV